MSIIKSPLSDNLGITTAEMESDPVKVTSDDSGSDAEDIDIEH